MYGGRKENREERMKCLESVTDIVYDKEVLALGNSGQYMSIWQVFRESNVIQRPIDLVSLIQGLKTTEMTLME